MRIVSWNCHYGFDGKKPETIKKNNADILVIPECREIDMKGSDYDEKHYDWYGDHKEATDAWGNINKEKDLGIGIFWKDGITVTRLPEWDNTLCKESDFRYLVPYKVEGNFESFTLIAVWTKNKADVSDPLDYVQKAHAAVDHYKSIGLLNGRVVLIGDFNSNVIWDDRYKKENNHSALVEKLEKIGIKECFSPWKKTSIIPLFIIIATKNSGLLTIIVLLLQIWLNRQNFQFLILTSGLLKMELNAGTAPTIAPSSLILTFSLI
jgi:exonuclease III